MRRLPFLLGPALILAACGGTHEPRRDSAGPASARPSSAAPAAVTLAGSVPDSAGAPDEAGPDTDLARNDPWLAVADSAVRRRLAGALFGARQTREFAECGDDAGSDNPTIGVVAVSARPLRRIMARYEPMGEGFPVRRAVYDVEVTSVAVLVPQWIASFPPDTLVINAYQYQVRLGTRTDTLSVAILQRADTAGHGGWEACDPTGPALSEGDGPGYWFFDAVASEPKDGMRITSWVPAGASWSQVVAAADSARKQK